MEDGRVVMAEPEDKEAWVSTNDDHSSLLGCGMVCRVTRSYAIVTFVQTSLELCDK